MSVSGATPYFSWIQSVGCYRRSGAGVEARPEATAPHLWCQFLSIRLVACLDVDTAGVRAAVAVAGAGARAAASVAVAARVVRARAGGVLAVVGTEVIAVGKGDERGEEEQDGVHDGKRPASLEHGAGLVGGPVVVRAGDGNITKAVGPVAVARDVGAVGVADAAQIPDGGDEGADEAEVDEADEHGIGRGAVVGEEGEHGPGEGKDRDDEEHENGIGREGVCLDEAIDEPGEHAHGGDQSQDLKDPIADEEECEPHICELLGFVATVM